MKLYMFGLLLVAAITAAPARAAGTYAGFIYGQVSSEEIDTENFGFVVGTAQEKGGGVEFFYTKTVAEDEFSLAPFDVEVTIDTYGLLAYYKTGTDDFDTYLKLQGGLAVVDLEFDFGAIGSIDDDTSGLAYGAAFGFRIGDGALEINYLVLPEFDDFEGIEIDAEVDFIGISYRWNF